MRNLQLFYLAVSLSIHFAQATISLGAASTYGALSAVDITNTGSTNIKGDIGTTGTSITGFPPGTYTGSEYLAANATVALNAANAAYDAVAALPGAITLTGDLGGQVLSPGVYTYSGSAQLTGHLTLAGTSDCNDAWYFQIGSTLTTSIESSIGRTGGALGSVFWNVGTSATVGDDTEFIGNIVAKVSVTLNTAAYIHGRVFALGASITMSSNVVQPEAACPGPQSSTSPARPSTSTLATNSIINICNCHF